jgi:hypothetical protein
MRRSIQGGGGGDQHCSQFTKFVHIEYAGTSRCRDPQSVYIAKEKVPTTTLDEFLDRDPDAPNLTIALKIDTQGYESEVLAGLSRWSGKVKVIMVEMSLTPLYEGGPLFVDLYQIIERRGYRCISIERGFTDPRSYEVLQVDAIFERVES